MLLDLLDLDIDMEEESLLFLFLPCSFVCSNPNPNHTSPGGAQIIRGLILSPQTIMHTTGEAPVEGTSVNLGCINGCSNVSFVDGITPLERSNRRLL